MSIREFVGPTLPLGERFVPSDKLVIPDAGILILMEGCGLLSRHSGRTPESSHMDVKSCTGKVPNTGCNDAFGLPSLALDSGVLPE